jgi:hypothetical protein
MKRLYTFLPLLLFLAPDGAGGGGAPAEEIPLDDWIKRLNEAEKKKRNAIVGELAKTLGIKPGEAYKKLNEAGWDPKNNSETISNGVASPAAGERSAQDVDQGPDNTRPGPSPDGGGPAAGGVTVTLRHKTPYPLYRRAGLLLTNQFKPYGVTAEQLAALKNDAWVEFQGVSGPDKT